MATTLKSIFAGLTWYVRGVLGADKYQKYLAYHRQSGSAEPPMTERQFWRDYTDRMEKNPGSRCC